MIGLERAVMGIAGGGNTGGTGMGRQWGGGAVGADGDRHCQHSLSPWWVRIPRPGWCGTQPGAGGHRPGTDRANTPHPCRNRGAPAPAVERPDWQPPNPSSPSAGAAGGARDERELQSRAAAAMQPGRSIAAPAQPGSAGGPSLPAARAEPRPAGGLGLIRAGMSRARDAPATPAPRGAKVTPLRPGSAVGIQGRSRTPRVKY